MSKKILVRIIPLGILLLFASCNKSSYDKCVDGKANLWNPNAKGNEYKGNERYWDAAKQCK